MDTKTLENIGLTDGEIRVYIALIKLGPSTSGPITDKSRVSRSKIYHILERLMQKGLVSYIIREKTRYYQAEDPVKIKDYVNKKEKELKKQKEEVDKLIPQLQLQKELEKTKSEAQIYKGFKGVQTIIEHVYQKLKKGETFYCLGIPSFQEEKYHSFYKYDHLRRIRAGIKCDLLFNKGTSREIMKNRNSYKGSDARYMLLPMDTPVWILVYKDVTALILQSDEQMSIEITNKQIAKSFKEYFNAFWKLSKPFK